jgi:hypothetical protein
MGTMRQGEALLPPGLPPCHRHDPAYRPLPTAETGSGWVEVEWFNLRPAIDSSRKFEQEVFRTLRGFWPHAFPHLRREVTVETGACGGEGEDPKDGGGPYAPAILQNLTHPSAWLTTVGAHDRRAKAPRRRSPPKVPAEGPRSEAKGESEAKGKAERSDSEAESLRSTERSEEERRRKGRRKTNSAIRHPLRGSGD